MNVIGNMNVGKTGKTVEYHSENSFPGHWKMAPIDTVC